MKIYIIAVGKIKDKMLRQKIAGYLERPVKGFEIIWKQLPDGEGTAEGMKRQEAEDILRALPARAFVVALDERGENLSSLEFAELVRNVINSGRELALIIGGAYGLDEQVRTRADKLLALSRLTFSHELARLVLAEQIFRMLSIIKGSPYHH
jgi:23S rRNA (pseudouridine1915-N3)-methyltransferase